MNIHELYFETSKLFVVSKTSPCQVTVCCREEKTATNAKILYKKQLIRKASIDTSIVNKEINWKKSFNQI